MNADVYLFKSIKKFNAVVNTFHYLSFSQFRKRLHHECFVTVGDDAHQLLGPRPLEVGLDFRKYKLNRVVPIRIK